MTNLTYDAQYMTRSYTSPGDEPYTEITTYQGKKCVWIPDGKFLYFRIDKSVVPSTMDTLVFKITYLDKGTGEVRLQYNATGGRNYESAVISRQNTGEWITATMAITDASLRNAQNHGDIRINAGNYIAYVGVHNGRMNPETEPKHQHLGGSTYSEFIGKSVAGYQAWFKVGGQKDFWHHWGNDAVAEDGTRWPRQYNHTFEIYPDLSLYQESDLYETGFADLGNGDRARLYNGQSKSVIAAHFTQMQAVGLDGVAVQRFLGSEMKSIADNPAAPLAIMRGEAERTNRLFYICYDITSNGLENTWDELIRFDWVYNIESNLRLTESPAYATVGGQPVVEIWGIGFTDRPGNATQTKALIEFLQSRGCYVIGGVPTYWREQRNDAKDASHGYEAVYQQCDMVSPWLVGRFSNTNEAQYFYGLQAGDMSYCNQHSMDYMPVLFAGFGWATWNTGSLNQAPRHAGTFLWDQACHAADNGCTNLYFAMFDEYDEGTALLNAATDYSMVPTDAYFLTYAADGRWLSADYYLRLAAQAGKDLASKRLTINSKLTTPYSLGPVYYRNSFEQRYTKYSTFPIDPCLFEADGACQLVEHDARTGQWALQVNGTGDSKIATLNTPVTEPLRLTAYTKTQDASLVLTTNQQSTITNQQSTIINQDGWYKIEVAVPATYVGQTLTALSARTTTSGVYFDDILLETDPLPTTLYPLPSSPYTDSPTPRFTKILKDGRLVIQRDGAMYDIMGK